MDGIKRQFFETRCARTDLWCIDIKYSERLDQGGILPNCWKYEKTPYTSALGTHETLKDCQSTIV